MAITVVAVGQVDPSPTVLQLPTAPKDVSAWLVDVTLGASTDYGATTGFVLTTAATAIGASLVVAAVVVQAKIAAGTTLLGFGVHDVANNKVRFLTAITNQTSATDYTPANGDIFRLLVVGV